MTRKPILVPLRLRHPSTTGWSWVDRRFVREHVAYLSREAVLLYFFLAAVADKHRRSFYSDGTLVMQLKMTLPTLVRGQGRVVSPRPDRPRDSLDSGLARPSRRSHVFLGLKRLFWRFTASVQCWLISAV